MDKFELKKASGDVFLEVRRMPDNAFILANWVGIQTLETIVMGGNQILSLLREKNCPGFLNSNKELIGPWETAVNWLAYKWVPKAKLSGLQFFAHVLSPGIYGQRSFQALYPKIADKLEVASFEDEKDAEAWLQSCYKQARTL
jgi:hypothetical protein